DDDEEGDDDDDQEEGSDDEQASDEEGKEFIYPNLSTHDEEETRDEESFDPIPKTPENTDDEGNGEENLGMNVGKEEAQDEEDEEDGLYKDVDINLGRGVQMADVHTTQEFEDSHVTLTTMDVQPQTTVAPLPLSEPTLTPSTIATVTIIKQAPTPLTTAPSTLLQDLPNFSSLFGFDHRLKTLEAISLSLCKQISLMEPSLQFLGSYKDIWINMNEAVMVAVQIQSDRLRDEAQAENNEFLKTIDENMHKIIKDQVKKQVKFLLGHPTHRGHPMLLLMLSEMELKKILIEKMEGNKSIHQSNKQRNLYKALVKVYESDKIILDTYRDTVTLKRRRNDDADKDEEPSAGSDRSESATVEEPMQTTCEMEEPSHLEFETDRDWNKTLSATHGSIQPWISELAKQTDSRSSFNELMDTPVDFSAFLMNRLKVNTLTPKLLAGRRVIPFDHFINNDLEYLRGGASTRKYTTSVTKTKEADYGHIKWIKDLVPRIMWIQEPVGYDKHALKRRIIAVTELRIVEWHNYKHLDWITNVYKKHRYPKACERPSTRCRKLPEEAQPHKAGYNKDKQNRLMQIDELHKFSDGTLTNVRTALDDRLKGIRMKYLPQTIWRKSDKDRAAAMIQAIDKQLLSETEPEGSTQGYPLVSVEVLRYDKRSKSENMGRVPTEMELILEDTQQGISHEVSVSAEEVEE
nr:hypothetical protein [Tanacetum cinerariifolium]